MQNVTNMANKNMFLFWGSGSMPSWKPILTLAEKGLWKGLPNRLISFDKEENACEEIMKLNPRGQVPTFTDGDLSVNESGAICVYLEDTYSNDSNRLIPNDSATKAKVYQRMFESENMLTKIIEPIAYYRMYTGKENWYNDQIKEQLVKAAAELKIWNNYLEGSEYLVGGKFTMADVFFFPWLAFLVRIGCKLQTNTNLQRYHDNICKRPSVQETWPPHWRTNPAAIFLDDLAG